MKDELAHLRVPPHSIEAEQSLLGALLLDNAAYDRVADLVTGHDFYRDDHRRIWRHISRLIEAGKEADILTVSESIISSEDKNKAGGADYLAVLAQNTPSSLNVRRYAELVRDRSMRRDLAYVGTEIAEEALSSVGDTTTILSQAEEKVLAIGEASARSRDAAEELKPILARVFDRIDNLYHRKSEVTGIPTGYVGVDQRTAGLQRGDLVIVAGRPSMGKTALALNVSEHVAIIEELPVLIFSMEMGKEQLAQRLLASVGRIDSHNLRIGKLTDSDWSQLSDAMAKLASVDIEIDDTGGLSAVQVRARARRWRRKYKQVGMVVVDYLQLMEAKERGENRATDIAEISRSLKAMAKELDCPVVALSQLNRKVDDRPDKRPIMSDLRESGAIEQDADLILFLYRAVVYHQDMPADRAAEAELIIGKQRNGPIGTVPLVYLGQFTRFENYASPDWNGWTPWRQERARGEVKNFSDFKSRAAGEPNAA